MVIITLQQIIDERISFLKEQINPENKPQVNKTFQLQIDAIRSAADNLEKVESIILRKKTLLKNSKDIHKSDSYLRNLMVWNGCSDK
jgi:hypothetical protein